MPPLEEGEPVTINGLLRIPATEGPLPLVILAHGCGGVSGAALGWARDFEALGIASLVLDSFAGRSISNVCSGAEGVNQASLLVDLFRAVDAMESNEYIDSSKVVVMGLSMGGRTALWSAQERFQDLYKGRPLAAHVAFYPLGCYIQLENETEVEGGPIRIFHGEDDNWLPITQCETYVDRMSAGGVDIEIFAYPDSHHAFDDRGLTDSFPIPGALSPRNCVVVEKAGVLAETSSGGPATPENSCVERGASIAYNPVARERASADLLSFLTAVFDG
jgi:dienelactone hydrolase